MKATIESRRPRAARQARPRAKQNYDKALRACESAAARMKAAGDELAAGWAALCREAAASASTTELLRKRAWCNVLELRLREQAHALEAARREADAVWDDVMLSARARELFRRFIKPAPRGSLASDAGQGFPLLRVASVLAAAHGHEVAAEK